MRRAAYLVAWALSLHLGTAAGAEAQRTLLFGPGAEFVAVGASRLATGGLDDRLAARGYPTFGRAAFALSLGGYRILPSRLTVGAEWHGVVQGDETRAGRRVGFGGGYGTLGIGYAAELSPRVRVYPRLGLGVGGLGVSIERPAHAPEFDEVLEDPDLARGASTDRDRRTTLTRTSPVIDLGAGAEFLLRGRARGRSPMVGVRLGYLTMPFRATWRLEERPVRGGPPATLAGPYARVVVGAGRRR